MSNRLASTIVIFNTFIFTTLISPTLFATSFSSQIDLSYTENNPDNSAIDSDQWTISGNYFFSPVSTDKGPLAEAVFIQRASHVGLSYTTGDSEIGSIELSDSDSLAISGAYVHKDTGWFIAGRFADTEDSAGQSTFSSTEIDSNDYLLTIGKYLFDTTSLSLSYLRSDIDQTFMSENLFCPLPFPCPPFIFETEIENTGYALDLKHLGKVGEFYYQLRAGYLDNDTKVELAPVQTVINPDIAAFEPAVGIIAFPFPPRTETDSSAYLLGASFYPLTNLAVSIDYVETDTDFLDSDTYTIAAEWFVIPTVAISLSYSDTNQDSFNFPSPSLLPASEATDFGDQENITLGAKVRF